MTRLSGIIKLRGKNVVLEDLDNSRLKKILHSRLRGNKFMFNIFYSDAPGYSEYKEHAEPYGDNYKDTHTDRHKDNHTDKHHDNHTDRSAGYDDIRLDGSDYFDSRYGDHTDKGYSERISYGYDEHTDGYS